MAKNNQGWVDPQGFNNAGSNDAQLKLAKQIAAMQDADLAYDMIETEMPGGQVVNGVYLPPAWTQQLATAMRRIDGRNRLEDRADNTAAFLDEQYGGDSVSFPGMKPNDNRMPIGSENVSRTAQAKPVNVTAPVAKTIPPLEEDIFEVYMPSGGLRFGR